MYTNDLSETTADIESENKDENLNSESAEEKLAKLLARANDQVPRLLKLETAEDFTLKENADEVIYIKSKMAVASDRTKRKIYYNKLHELNIVELVMKIWRILFETDFTSTEKKSARVHNVMRASQVILWNGTDIDMAICRQAVDAGVHTFFLQCLQDEKLSQDEFTSDFMLGVARGIFGIFHNLLQNVEGARTAFREQNAVQIISHYKDKGSTMVQCKALLCLAYIVDEQENEKLLSHDKNFTFMLDILRSAMKQDNHHSRKYGYNVQELVSTFYSWEFLAGEYYNCNQQNSHFIVLFTCYDL